MKIPWLLCLGVLSLASCKKPQPAISNSEPAPAGEKVEACSLLSAEEVAAVQKAPITASKRTAGPFQDFTFTQCFYDSSEPDRSVSLMVIQRDPAHDSRRAVATYWRNTFEPFERPAKGSRDDGKESKKEDSDATNGREAGEGEKGEKEKLRAIKVTGLGDEAFWSGPAKVGGVLYVRHGEKILRIGVGGPGTDEEKLEKSKTLAVTALSRLPK